MAALLAARTLIPGRSGDSRQERWNARHACPPSGSAGTAIGSKGAVGIGGKRPLLRVLCGSAAVVGVPAPGLPAGCERVGKDRPLLRVGCVAEHVWLNDDGRLGAAVMVLVCFWC